MIVKGSGDEVLTTALNDVLRQQVLIAQLAETGTTPQEVAESLANVNVAVTALEPVDPQRGQRLAIGLIVAALLYYSLLVYGTMVAQGVVEEKSSRVVEMLLATVRPWQLLLGKVIGLGAVGLLQLLVISTVGLALSSAFDVIDVGALGGTALFTGVLWYLLGFFLYATVFAAAASLVSRQEELQSVLTPISMTIIVAFVAGINLMIGSPSGQHGHDAVAAAAVRADPDARPDGDGRRADVAGGARDRAGAGRHRRDHLARRQGLRERRAAHRRPRQAPRGASGL